MGPFGSKIKAENFVSSGIPVIKGGNLNGDFINEESFDFLTKEKADELRASNAFRRDIIITHRGTIGQVGIIPDNSLYNRYVVSQSQLKVTLDENIVNPYFVYYFLRSPLGQRLLLSNASQVGVPAIAQASTSVKNISIPCPDKLTQNAIVGLLLLLDNKIKTNKKINQTLEQMAKALFKSWFVDFEPVKAKMAVLEVGGSQEDATLAAMTAITGKDTDALAVFEREYPEQYAELKATAELFPSAMRESELGEIPDGWNVSNIKDNVDVRDGTHASPKASDSGYHLVTSKNITSGYLDRRSCYYISDADYHDVNKRSRVSCGDILISMIGTVGALYFVAENNVDYAIKNIGLIRTSERNDLQAFIFYHLKSKGGANYIQSRLAGTTQKYLSLKQLREIPLVMPTQDVLAAFNKKTFLHEIHANQEMAGTLVNIRDTLLPKLLSGEITLPEAEQAVSEVENV